MPGDEGLDIGDGLVEDSRRQCVRALSSARVNWLARWVAATAGVSPSARISGKSR